MSRTFLGQSCRKNSTQFFLHIEKFKIICRAKVLNKFYLFSCLFLQVLMGFMYQLSTDAVGLRYRKYPTYFLQNFYISQIIFGIKVIHKFHFIYLFFSIFTSAYRIYVPKKYYCKWTRVPKEFKIIYYKNYLGFVEI